MSRRALPPRPEEPRTQTSAETCDVSLVEKAYWRATSPQTGRVITLCNYHHRQHQVALAVDGWSVEEIGVEDDI